jgi:hypothetical protein
MGYGVHTDKMWLQEDGTRPHTASIALDYLKKSFGNRLFSYRFPHVHNEGFKCPPLPPVLNPCEISRFLWGYLKNTTFNINPHALDIMTRKLEYYNNKSPLLLGNGW